MTNEDLRAHVTRTGFDLSLGKTHIAALVQIDLKLKDNRPAVNPQTNKVDRDRPDFRTAPAFRQFVPGVDGLIRRGLVEHIFAQRRKSDEDILTMTPRRIWRITPAGRLVVGLLKEAGLYQEYAALLPLPRREEDAS